jgi:hypothetical protein
MKFVHDEKVFDTEKSTLVAETDYPVFLGMSMEYENWRQEGVRLYRTENGVLWGVFFEPAGMVEGLGLFGFYVIPPKVISEEHHRPIFGSISEIVKRLADRMSTQEAHALMAQVLESA